VSVNDAGHLARVRTESSPEVFDGEVIISRLRAASVCRHGAVGAAQKTV
jgi:hypothetical protein